MFQWNPACLHAGDFRIIGKTIRKRETEYSQITGIDKLPKRGKYTVAFKIIRYGGEKSDIYLGILTENRLNSRWSGGKDAENIGSIGYLTFHKSRQLKGEGGIIVDGVYQVGSFQNLLPELYIAEGSTLVM